MRSPNEGDDDSAPHHGDAVGLNIDQMRIAVSAARARIGWNTVVRHRSKAAVLVGRGTAPFDKRLMLLQRRSTSLAQRFRLALFLRLASIQQATQGPLSDLRAHPDASDRREGSGWKPGHVSRLMTSVRCNMTFTRLQASDIRLHFEINL